MNFYRIIFSIFFLQLICSCNEPALPAEVQKTPEAALKAFYEALNVLNIENAILLSDAPTARQLHLLGVYLNMSSEEEIKAKQNELMVEMKSLSCVKEGVNAVCKICCAKNGSEKEIELIFKNNKWFVSQHLGMTDNLPQN